MKTFELLHGDCRKVLATLPEASVQCCITSPPYWGLRDYGTANWQGGDAGCDHIDKEAEAERQRNHKGLARNATVVDGALRDKKIQNGIDKSFQYKTTCAICGAQRVDIQLGLEETPEDYVANMVAVFREVWRVLRDDGTLWLNLGDSYSSTGGSNAKPYKKITTGHKKLRDNGAVPNYTRKVVLGLKPKDLVGIPWRVAFALQADGWYLRQDIIWSKPNPMPEGVRDRCTKSHEYIFLLTKRATYYYDSEAIKEKGVMQSAGSNQRDTQETHGLGGGNSGINTAKARMKEELKANGYVMRNKRSVWTVTTKPYKGAHFATFPADLIEPCVLAGTSEKGCCEKCGKPWERVTIKDIEQPDGYGNMGANGGKWQGENKQSSGHRIQKNMNALRAAGRNHDNPFPTKTTTGWRSTCECGGEPVQCVVLDLFNGAGTTGVVAVDHGRHYIGIDLNSEYIEIAHKRIQRTIDGTIMPLF